MAGLAPAIHAVVRDATREEEKRTVAPRLGAVVGRPGVGGRDKPGHDGEGREAPLTSALTSSSPRTG